MKEITTDKIQTAHYHRFLDEAGDTTFYAKGRVPMLGNEGVSKTFILGMFSLNEPLKNVREKVIALQDEIANDKYFKGIPSIEKKKSKHGYYLHAKDDIPEVRKMAFELIKSLDCNFECVVARKAYEIYERKHNGKEAEFYADLISHLLKNKLQDYQRLVLNIAERSQCTTHQNLNKGLNKALERAFAHTPNGNHQQCKVDFNVQQPTTEPLLNLTDYCCWAVQRVFEKGETRYYDFLENKISLVVDLYDYPNIETGLNHYDTINRLTSENLVHKKSP
jgi:hypothetical protein